LPDNLVLDNPKENADVTQKSEPKSEVSVVETKAGDSVKLGKVICITSGKGGVSKTTSSASLATGLALRGFKTVVIDFDVGLRNLDLIMGVERRVVFDFVNVISGEAKLAQALIKDKRTDNLYILPTSQTKDKDALSKEGVGKILNELKAQFDYVVCDSPAGIEQGAMMALYFADHAIVVANPEVSSVRDSDRILGIVAAKTKRAESGMEPVKTSLLLARYSDIRVSKGDMLTVEDVLGILAIPLIGVVPECKSVLKASNTGMPVILDPASKAGQAYAAIVDNIIGGTTAKAPAKPVKKGFFSRLFGRKS
jgi:septum site-determining protein MinD